MQRETEQKDIGEIEKQRNRASKRDHETKQQRDGEKQRWRDGETKRQRGREAERQRDKETKRQRGRETERQRDKDIKAKQIFRKGKVTHLKLK